MLHLVYVALCKILTKQTPEPTGIIAFSIISVNILARKWASTH